MEREVTLRERMILRILINSIIVPMIIVLMIDIAKAQSLDDNLLYSKDGSLIYDTNYSSSIPSSITCDLGSPMFMRCVLSTLSYPLDMRDGGVRGSFMLVLYFEESDYKQAFLSKVDIVSDDSLSLKSLRKHYVASNIVKNNFSRAVFYTLKVEVNYSEPIFIPVELKLKSIKRDTAKTDVYEAKSYFDGEKKCFVIENRLTSPVY